MRRPFSRLLQSASALFTRGPCRTLSFARVVVVGLCAVIGLSAQHAMPSDALRSTLPYVQPRMFSADFWVRKCPDPDLPILDAAGVASFNARVKTQLPQFFFDLASLGPTVSGEKLRALIEPPEYPAVSIWVNGKPMDPHFLEGLFGRMNTEGIKDSNPVRYGYVVRRANMRRYPSDDFCGTSPDERCIDQLQANSLDPATPVAILHASKDDQWLYVCSRDYSGWISANHVALEPDHASFLAYLGSPRFLVVTGSLMRLGFNPYSPELSELPFEMGARLPLVVDDPVPSVVDHQDITGNYIVRLPTRGSDGRVCFKLALVAVSQDVCDGYLPYTRANLLRQAFKALGERYAWGGLGIGKDCSAFVKGVYASCGLTLPRDSGQQRQVTNAADVRFDPLDLDYARRAAAIRALLPGAELFWGGHVLLYVGEHEGRLFALHDVWDYGDVNRPRKVRIPWLAYEPVDIYQVTLMELTLQQSCNGKAFERLIAGKRYE